MKRNVELLERTMQHIKDDPKHHRQGIWITSCGDCGTAACYAGWALLLDGMTAGQVRRLASVSDVAQHQLGINAEEAYILFHGENSRQMLELMVKDLVNGDELKTLDFYRDQQEVED